MTALNSGHPILTIQEIRGIFSNIEMIYNYNSLLCEALRERLADWHEKQVIGDIMIRMVNILI